MVSAVKYLKIISITLTVIAKSKDKLFSGFLDGKVSPCNVCTYNDETCSLCDECQKNNYDTFKSNLGRKK